jgi:hypothetical protein
MERSTVTTKALSRRHKFALIWIDFLVVSAAVMAFAAIVVGNSSAIRSSTGASPHARDAAVQTSQLPEDPGLVKARIRLATGGPWS